METKKYTISDTTSNFMGENWHPEDKTREINL